MGNEREKLWVRTSEESTSSSFVDSAAVVRLAAFLLPARTDRWGKISSDLGPTIETTNGSSVRLKWIRDLYDGAVRPRLAALPSLQTPRAAPRADSRLL
jgi:hypothetical protein